MGKFFGPGYVRVGPITAGPFGIGCLFPMLLMVVAASAIVKGVIK